MKTFVFAGIWMLVAAMGAEGALVGFDRPHMDAWMYPNGFERGTRDNAPVFGGDIGLAGGDDRLSQYVVGWNTAASGIPTGLGAASYEITRVTLRVTHFNGDVFRYDPTTDSYRTYLPTDHLDYLPDTDTGRPIELFGLGLRNGFTGLGFDAGGPPTLFSESSASASFGVGGGPNTRHAFAVSASSPRGDKDVSDNVSGGFEATPFAVGVTAAALPGQLVPEDTQFTFEMNLADVSVREYLRNALNTGELGLTLSSLHPATFGGVSPGEQNYPRIYTREYYDFLPEVVPQLEIEYTIVPEPSASHALLIGVAMLVSLRGWRRRNQCP
jgi:hypothetical protein